uniref:PDZ domain-containing protein n=1 Tax=Buteo japonicus TaxID=224669 RepID=A0A8C0BQ82_9AVES
MEVTLKTEVEAGASGFSVTGGGNEGIFIKKVLKESPASKIFSLREGDQLLSATIFFDNIKYEDALKILQYSEPYRVQFSLKRKIAGKEELEHIHSTAHYKKERISQISEMEGKLPNLEASTKKPEGLEGEVSLPTAEVDLPSATVTATGEGPALGLKADVPGAKAEGAGWKLEKPSLKMPKADIKAPKVDISLPSVDVTLPKASVDLQAPEAALTLEGEAKGPEKEAAKTKDGKFKMPKFGMPSFGWSSSREAKATVPQVTVPSGTAEVDVTLPAAEIQAPGVEVTVETAAGADGEKARFKMPDVKMPSVKLPKVKAPHVQVGLPKAEVSLPKAQAEVQEGELALQGPDAEGGLEVAAGKVEGGGMKIHMPKVKVPSVVFSKPTVKAPKLDADVSLHKVDASLPEADLKAGAGDVSIAAPDIKLPSVEGSLEIQAPEVDLKVPSADASLGGADLDAAGLKGKLKMPKFDKPKFGVSPPKAEGLEGEVSLPTAEVDLPSATVTLEKPSLKMPKADIKAPKVDISLPSVDVTLPKASVDLQAPEAALTLEGEAKGPEKEAAKTKDGKFKMPKFGMPSFGWSSSREAKATVAADADVSLKEPQVTVPSGTAEVDKGSSGEGAGMGIKMPKVTVPSLEFSKPEVKAPKIEVDISMPTGEVVLPTGEEGDLTLKSAAANASLSTSDIKMKTEGSLDVKSPDTSVERTSSEIVVGDVEIKTEGPEGKTKMSKFQMPKFGITHSKGKGSEKEVSHTKSEVKVPQLKAMVEIDDIAVEAPNLEVECGTGTETYSPKVKMTKADNKASEADVHLPPADISVPKTDSDIQDSDAALKIKGEIKQDGDGEGKEGHFKMPKFKLPSFSWSPKKEASVKLGSGANLEDHKLAVVSSRIDTEVRGTEADDQGPGPDLDLEISAGKVEQKSPIKKPQFVMPKISLSKIKVPKSQTHSPKVEADATIPNTEREGDDSIQIPDIERSHSKRTEEGAQISIKLADVKIPALEFSKIETGASQTEMGVSSAKIDAALPPSEGSFQQVVLKSSSVSEDTMQKTSIKFPKGEASIELRSPEIERSSVVDGRKIKLEGPEGKIKMPKFQKPKFGISLTKGKGPETEISSPKIEAELPQLKMTNEIADIAVGVPTSELTSDMSDSGVGVCKIKTPQVLTAGIEAPKVDISPQSVSKPMTEGAIEKHQGWFKMPKFRIPAFGSTSLKEKKGDADTERSTEKAQVGIPSVKVQTETSIPETTFSLPHAVAEI